MTNRRTHVLIIGLAILAASCGGAAPGTRPDDMSAEEHARASQTHEAAAQRHDAQYDPNAVETRETAGGVAARAPESVGSARPYNPTAMHHEEAATHHGHAQQHAAAGQTLQQFEAAECRAFPAESRAACPLLSDVTGIEDIEGGVSMGFAPGVPVDAVRARMRCHFAYARAHGYEGMGTCPLYIRGIDVRAGAGGTVELVGNNPATVRLIRERTRMHTTGGAL